MATSVDVLFAQAPAGALAAAICSPLNCNSHPYTTGTVPSTECLPLRLPGRKASGAGSTKGKVEVSSVNKAL